MPNLRLPSMATVFCLSLLPSVASAADNDVQSLYSACKMSDASQEFAVCVGFISGVGETLHYLGLAPDAQPFKICGAPTHGAMVQAFLNWAEKHPEAWSYNQIRGVILALGETWPCKSN